MTTPSERCAESCLRRHDTPIASAPPVHRWLLVEQPGPWGRDALRQSPLRADVAEAVAAQAVDVGARVLLIRRPGRAHHPGPRRWALVDSDAPGVRWSEFTDPLQLKDLRLNTLSAPVDATPVYLVCTHGKHDACCAIRGRPLAAALAAARPSQSWECSHVGGDRFAANLVVFPHGLYYGQVHATEATALADRHDAGLISTDWLRGHSILAAPAQAAQHFAREHLSEYRIDALPVQSLRQTSQKMWEAVMATEDNGTISVTVRAHSTRSDTPLTCAATTPATIRTFELVAMARRPSGSCLKSSDSRLS